MKEFNLKQAKMGAKVCTRDGRRVKILTFSRKGDHPIVGLVGRHEEVFTFTEEGRYHYRIYEQQPSEYDLFIADGKSEGWINVYPDSRKVSGLYNTEKEAKEAAEERAITLKVEWPDEYETI